MKIKTVINQYVSVWVEQLAIVEVEDLEEFKELRENNNLDSVAIDYDIYDILWESAEYLKEDNSDSIIEEIIKE